MGWDGAGGYSRQHNFSADASSGIKILALRVDQEFDDVASAMTIALTRNGQNVPTGNLPMGGFRHINVGAPVSVNNYMRSREFIENVPIFMNDTASSADRISVSAQYFTSVSANQAPGDGTRILVRALSDKSSAALYLNGHSANVEFQDGTLADAALVSGGIYEMLYSSADTAWKVTRPDLAKTAAERTAVVTPTNNRYDSLPIIDLRRYGLSTGASGAANRAAFEAAIDVAGALAGAILQAPPGTFVIDATVTIDVDNVFIRGVGRGTIWSFSPSVADVLFDFTRVASSILFGGVIDCQFASSNSTDKTAIRVNDGRKFLIENIVMADAGWPGSGSIGVHTLGREYFTFRKNQIRCARPVVVDVNANDSINCDFYLFHDCSDGSTLSTGTCYEFLDGVALFNLVFDHCSIVLGKWGVKWIDTTSSTASYNVTFRNFRTEQATDATGYSVELTSTAQRVQDVFFDNCHFDLGRNGVKLRQFERATFINSSFTGGVGRTNLDLEFETYSNLELVNTHVQVASTVTLADEVLVQAAPFNPSETVISKTARYRYDETNVISQRPAYGYGEARIWQHSTTLADAGQISTPITRAAYICANVRVTAYSATGPIHSTGEVGWTKDGTTTKCGGSSNFVVTVVGGVELRCLDGGSGLIIQNALGQTVDIVIDAVFR